MQRIILMGMNSYMLLDSRHDTIIQKAYSYYCISRQLQFCRTAELTADEIRYYILIYDAIQQSAVNDPGNRKYLNDIAQLLEAHHMEKGRRLLQDYDAVMDKVAEAEELSADHRPSTLEKLAELASDTSAPKSSARSAPEL